MLRIYGSMLCKDCISCLADLDKAGVVYQFLDFAESLSNLKEFMEIRDNNPLFDQVKAEGSIGIPCLVKDNGQVTLQWDEF